MDALSPPCTVTKGESRTMSRMAEHSGSEIVSVGSMFDLIVLPSGRKMHSCGRAIMRERRFVLFIVSMSVLSIVKVRPGIGVRSRRRRIKRMREDFPLVNISGGIVESGMGGDVYLPVRPQTAIFSPELLRERDVLQGWSCPFGVRSKCWTTLRQRVQILHVASSILPV
jgi:hypothetical protein